MLHKLKSACFIRKTTTLNKCVFKCFANVAGLTVRSLNSTGNSFLFISWLYWILLEFLLSVNFIFIFVYRCLPSAFVKGFIKANTYLLTYFQQLGPATAKALKPQSVLWLGTTRSPRTADLKADRPETAEPLVQKATRLSRSETFKTLEHQHADLIRSHYANL